MKPQTKKKPVLLIVIIFIIVAAAIVSIILIPKLLKKDTAKNEIPFDVSENYFDKNSKVIEKINVEESKNVKTEKDALSLFIERGFDQYPVVYDYTINGEYGNDSEISEVSANKHPRYFTNFLSANGDVWRVFLINDMFIAYPASLLLESETTVDVLYSESNMITSYDPLTNQFFVTIPFESAVIVKTINRIDAESLNKITLEDVVK